MFDSLPQLTELDLDAGWHEAWPRIEPAARVLLSLTQLRVLRLGLNGWESPRPLPPRLERLRIASKMSAREEEALLSQLFLQRERCVVVEFESLDSPLPSLFEEAFEGRRYSPRRVVRQ